MPRDSAPEPGYRERWLSAQDGLRLYFRDYGDPLAEGTPVLCLSGLARNSQDFHDLARRLSARRRVVTLDYRGRGRSDHDPNWRNYRPEVYLRDVAHLLAATGLHGLAVCGTSLGGILAMGLAVAAPAALAGVILNDIGPEVDPGGLARIRDYVGREQSQPDLEAAAAHLKELMPTLGLKGDERWRRLAEATYRWGDDGLWHKNWDLRLAKTLNGEVPDLWPYYRALGRLPVLAIRGTQSDVLSPETFSRMAAVKPDQIQVTLEGVGHAPSLDEPQAEQAIDDFLARLDSQRRH